MKTIILTLDEAVRTELKGAELLKPEDKIVFVYQKGKDSISIAIHNMLASLQCKTEFAEVPAIASKTESENTTLAYISYLIGANKDSIFVDSDNTFAELTYLGFSRATNIRSAINIKDCDSHGLEEKVRKQPGRKRKEKTHTTETETETSKEVIPDKGEVVAEVVPVTEKKENAEVKKLRTRKTTTKQVPASTISSIEDLKSYLKSLATDDFDPSTMTMGIFESVKNSIANKSELEEEMKKTIIISKKIEMINATVKENWTYIVDGVRNIVNK